MVLEASAVHLYASCTETLAAQIEESQHVHLGIWSKTMFSFENNYFLFWKSGSGLLMEPSRESLLGPGLPNYYVSEQPCMYWVSSDYKSINAGGHSVYFQV